MSYALVVILVGGSAGWALAEVAPVYDPAADPEAPPDDPRILVHFITYEETLSTPVAPFGSDGRASFTPLTVPYQNVSRMSVTVDINMQDSLLRDDFKMRVTGPDGTYRDGQMTSPDSFAGYEMTVTPIQDWVRKVVPTPMVYTTADPQQALAWAAENHTDARSTGEWAAHVSVTPPGTPLTPRDGTVGLTFRFVVYEAVAFPQWVPEDAGEDAPAAPTDTDADAEGGAERASRQPVTHILTSHTVRSMERR